MDISSDLLAVSGVPQPTYLTVRLIGHLGAAAWIGAAAWSGRHRFHGWFRGVGIALAAVLGGYTLVAVWVPPAALAVSVPLLIAWWIMVGRRLDDSGTA